MKKKDNILSIFIDEAGDYGTFGNAMKDFSDQFYIVCLVLHEQNHDITKQIAYLDNRLKSKNFTQPMIHCGPLIRKEYPFKGYKSEDVRGILNDLIWFVKSIEITYYPIIIDKKICSDRSDVEKYMLSSITNIINARYQYFNSFSNIHIYYDNGQRLVSNVLNETFEKELLNTDRRLIQPKDYKLFQVADLFCTLTLIEQKRQRYHFSPSESRVFNSKIFKKQFLQPMLEKQGK